MPDEAEPSAHAEVRAVLRAHPVTRAWPIRELEPLEGGLNNRSWRIEVDGDRYVVRLSGADDASLGIDRTSEAAMLEAAGSAGLAPRLVVVDLESRLLVTRYVEGIPWSFSDARAPSNVERMARVLTRLHGLAPALGVRVRSFSEAALRLERVARERGAATDAGLAGHADELFARLEATDDNRPVLCHDDLHHLNVLDDGRELTLIDWEYGGLGNPVYDLASFASYHELDFATQAQFWRAYSGPADASQFADALWTFDYVQWLWYLVTGLGADDEARECRVRANRVRQRLET
jgi:thiamine kinase-like enzyme